MNDFYDQLEIRDAEQRRKALFEIINQINTLQTRQRAPMDYRIFGKVSLAGQLRAIPFERRGQLGPTANNKPGAT